MFRHRLHKATRFRTHFDWFLLSFLAGSVNAGGFLAAHRFVSHVTGFATLFGVAAANRHWDQALGLLSIPVYFLLGAMVSAVLVDRNVHRGRRPHYALVMTLVASCLLAAALGGHLGYFGEFGSEPRLRQQYILLALLCGASGLQNAAVSTASGMTIRTTHLTGLTTDLGTGLVRAFSNPSVYDAEIRAAQYRIGTIVSFGLGSAVGAWIYLAYSYLGFLLPAALALFCVFEALSPARRLAKIRRRRARDGSAGGMAGPSAGM